MSQESEQSVWDSVIHPYLRQFSTRPITALEAKIIEQTREAGLSTLDIVNLAMLGDSQELTRWYWGTQLDKALYIPVITLFQHPSAVVFHTRLANRGFDISDVYPQYTNGTSVYHPNPEALYDQTRILLRDDRSGFSVVDYVAREANMIAGHYGPVGQIAGKEIIRLGAGRYKYYYRYATGESSESARVDRPQ